MISALSPMSVITTGNTDNRFIIVSLEFLVHLEWIPTAQEIVTWLGGLIASGFASGKRPLVGQWGNFERANCSITAGMFVPSAFHWYVAAVAVPQPVPGQNLRSKQAGAAFRADDVQLCSVSNESPGSFSRAEVSRRFFFFTWRQRRQCALINSSPRRPRRTSCALWGLRE